MAKKSRLGLQLKPMSVRITFVAFSLFLLFAALDSFNILPTAISADKLSNLILGVAATSVIFIEIGLAQVFKSRGRNLDILGLIGIIAGVIVLLTVILEFWDIPALTAILNPIQGLVFGVLTVSFFVEAFRN